MPAPTPPRRPAALARRSRPPARADDPPLPTPTAVQLAAARGGCQASAGALVDGIRGFAWLVARRYARKCGPGVVADDLAAAGLVGAWNATTRYEAGKAAGKGWLTYVRAAVAREVAREARRRVAALGPGPGGLGTAAAPDPELAADRAELAARVRAAVNQLPGWQWLLVTATAGLAGRPLTVEAAARLAGMPRRQAVAELVKARATLRELLGDRAGD